MKKMKLFKKSIAMFLVISVMCSTAMFTSAVYANGTTVVYGQDFESGKFKTIGIADSAANKTEPTNANYIYKGSSVVANKLSDGSRKGDGVDSTFNINNYGKIIKTYSYASLPAKEIMIPSNSADIYIDADIYVDENAGKMHLMLVDDRAAALSGASVDFHFAPYAYADLRISASEGTAALLTSYNATRTDASGNYPSAVTAAYSSSFKFTAKSWHKVRFVLHETSYDVYVDGEVAAQSQSFHTGTGFDVRRSDFSSLVIVTDASNSSSSSFIGFDNIYMYKAAAGSAPANYARHLIKANETAETINTAYSLGDITDSERQTYIETVNVYRDTYKDAVKTGAGESVFEEIEEVVDYIISQITLTIPEGGLAYSNKFDDGTRSDAVYGINNYWYDYTNNNEKTLYPHNKEAAFSLNMKDAVTVAKEGPNAGVVVEFDLKTSYLRETGSNLRLQVTDLVNTVEQGRKWFNVFINGRDGLVYKCYNGSTAENIASETYTTPFEDNKWYRVRIEIDITDGASAFNGKQTMYIDGREVFKNTYTSTTAWGAFQELNGLQIVKDANDDIEGYGPIVAVDNLSVFKYNNNSEKPVNRGNLISYVRNSEFIKNTSKLYDESTKNGVFTTELNKAIAAADAVDATDDSLATALGDITWYMTSGRTGMLTPDNKESYYVNNFIWNDKNGEAVYEAEAGGSLAGIRITKNSPVNVVGKVMVAQYNGDVVSDVRIAAIPQMQNGETRSLSFETSFAVPAENTDNYSYKAFVWANSMLPVTESEYSVVNTDKTGKKIFVVGDSIACNYNYDGANNDYPQQGFGQALVNFFDNERITIDNRAIAGYSTKKFIDDGKWAEVIDAIQSGDYLIIAFGHNDQKVSSDLNTYAYTTYRDNLERFVKEARAKGANPILMTSVPRALTTQNIFVGVPDHMEYPLVVRSVAEEYNVPLVDALAKVNSIITNVDYAPADAKRDIYLFVDPQDNRYIADTAFATSKYYNGVSDTTHLSVYGAQVVAKVICDSLREINHPLAGYMEAFEPVKK